MTNNWRAGQSSEEYQIRGGAEWIDLEAHATTGSIPKSCMLLNLKTAYVLNETDVIINCLIVFRFSFI